jgi:hypothetical protein
LKDVEMDIRIVALVAFETVIPVVPAAAELPPLRITCMRFSNVMAEGSTPSAVFPAVTMTVEAVALDEVTVCGVENDAVKETAFEAVLLMWIAMTLSGADERYSRVYVTPPCRGMSVGVDRNTTERSLTKT